MLNIFIGFIIIIGWAIALAFLILTIVFRNKKKLMFLFLGLFLLFLSNPLIIFKYIEVSHKDNNKYYVGTYTNQEENYGELKLILKEDFTFSFLINHCKLKAIKGQWNYNDIDQTFIDLRGENSFIQLIVSQDKKQVMFNNPITIDTCNFKPFALIKN